MADKSHVVRKKRLIFISLLSVGVACAATLVAKVLILFISAITNLAFFGTFYLSDSNPADNSLGLWVIIIPAIGGVIVGLLAYYGSSAIRGHGIPEAMEKILTNKSRIKPAITFLKPVSSAIAIGTGGPFGAEGPIIATGGALGSTLGQLIRITHYERKIILAAGATAGMSAIFGSPIAAIFLAIELLLFEFSPKSIIPVALACITGAAGHQLLFEAEPVFAFEGTIEYPSNLALATYSIIGIGIGLCSVLATKFVYFVEDSFEKLPIHWMWWPALGGIGVGLIGYFFPRTLGVGYNNITDILSGSLPLTMLLSICVMKFLSWVIALGSGTSGGTLAPLLTIGGALGGLMGSVVLMYFPETGISIQLTALVGMSAMFAGASRAFLTSIVFALETTAEANALLPLLATCGAAYIISFLLMKNTIMTEKIARRGIRTPESFEPDLLGHTAVKEVMQPQESATDIETNTQLPVIRENQSLREAVELMVDSESERLLVYSDYDPEKIVGVVTLRNILSIYRKGTEDYTKASRDLSLRKGLNKLVEKTYKRRGIQK